ncbi:MAG: hypothetical protein EBR34_16425 [Sphingomonadaceae bacterium]|nr:hypothetical protein [Sphingomonadaceae bacterium]
MADPWAGFEAVQPEANADWSGFDAAHPASGPSGSMATDALRFAGTAGTNALGGILGLPRGAAMAADWAARGGLTDWGVPQPIANAVGTPFRAVQPEGGFSEAMGKIQQPGGGELFPTPQAAREMAYQTTGATEYQPGVEWTH